VYGDIPFGIRIKTASDIANLVKKYAITKILFVTNDGVAVEIEAPSIYQITFFYKKGKWFSYSDTLPKTINLRDIDYVAVKSEFVENRIALFYGNDAQEHITAYEWIKTSFEVVGMSVYSSTQDSTTRKRPFPLDEIEKKEDGREITKYVSGSLRHKLSNSIRKENTPFSFFQNITNEQEVENVLVTLTSGEEYYISFTSLYDALFFNGAYWTLIDTTNTSYKKKVNSKNEKKSKYNTIKNKQLSIIWVEPPEISINDIYPIIKDTKPLLLFFIDGLGWSMLENLKARQNDCSLVKSDYKAMRVAYPPRTLVAYVAVACSILDRLNITQQLQRQREENLFHQKNKKEATRAKVSKPKLFYDLPHKIGYILENDQSFYEAKFPFIYHTDRNNNGTIDDEIFESALIYIEKDFDLLLIHFHSIDDFAHKHGPYHLETRKQIEIISNYIEQILEKWEGKYIIFSDHGLHWDDDGGKHGTNEISDIVGIIRVGIGNGKI